MKNVKFSDWQDLSLKKNIEEINKTLKKKPLLNILLLVEIVIGICALCINIIAFNYQLNISLYWFVLIIFVTIGLPLVLFLIVKLPKQNKRFLIKKQMIKFYVDKFDNEICTYAMMANSFYENTIKEENEKIKYFYISQSCYYVNKCINELYIMKTLIQFIFLSKKGNEKIVDKQRLILMIKLLKETRKNINDVIKNVVNKDNGLENYIAKENEHHDLLIKDFLNSYNTLYGEKNCW